MKCTDVNLFSTMWYTCSSKHSAYTTEHFPVHSSLSEMQNGINKGNDATSPKMAMSLNVSLNGQKGKSVLGGVLCPVVTATDNFSRPQASRGVLILPNRLPLFLPSDEKACRETIHHTIHQVSWEILIPHLPKRCSKRTCFMIFLGTTVKTHCSRTLWYTWQLSES